MTNTRYTSDSPLGAGVAKTVSVSGAVARSISTPASVFRTNAIHARALHAGAIRAAAASALSAIVPGACAGASSKGSALRPTAQAIPVAPSLDAVTDGFSLAIRAEVEKLRTATAPYHDVRAAQAAGYPLAMPACVADSTMGGMGRHYFDRAVYDEKLDIAHPEMLIYAPGGAGQPDHLVAVEYVIPFRLLPSTAKPPRLFGQELKRHEEFKYWYLHVWAWNKNSAGLFSDWDPSITCS